MRVFSNTAMSADGKISALVDQHITLGSHADRLRMSELRAQADAVVVGGQTFRNWPLPLTERDEHILEPGRVRRPIINAVLTRRGVVHAREIADAWPSDAVSLIVYGPEHLDVQSHRDRYRADVVTLGDPGVLAVLDDLERRGCSSVLIEGGGNLIFDVLSADRLDEMFLTICPSLIGGTSAPTLVDGAGFQSSAFRRLRLVTLDRVGDEVFLHYAVQR